MSFSENTSDSDWKEAKSKVKLNGSTGCGKQKYSQKFCEKWLNLFDPWLRRSADDPNKPFCRACQCRLDCNRCHLVRHERTTKHKRNLESLMTRGEGAVRKELSVRQERSKYYHQRKRALNTVKSQPMAIVKENNLLESTTAFVPEDRDIEESSRNVAIIEGAPEEEIPSPLHPIAKIQNTLTTPNHNNISPPKTCQPTTNMTTKGSTNSSSNKEGLKLLMQIQQDKNELMESFRELIGVQLPHPPQREKNHVDLFFDSVSSSVKALSPKLVAEAKMRVSQLICELELRALKDSGSNGDNVGIEMLNATPQANGQHCMSHHPHYDIKL